MEVHKLETALQVLILLCMKWECYTFKLKKISLKFGILVNLYQFKCIAMKGGSFLQDNINFTLLS